MMLILGKRWSRIEKLLKIKVTLCRDLCLVRESEVLDVVRKLVLELFGVFPGLGIGRCHFEIA
jgi:hypothetical protein